MDALLRSASHSIVTTVLLVIWSGLLLGLLWRVLSLALPALWQWFAYQMVPILVHEPPRLFARLPGTINPRLVSLPPEQRLAKAPLPRLPDPDNEPTRQLFHKSPTFVGHKEKTTA